MGEALGGVMLGWRGQDSYPMVGPESFLPPLLGKVRVSQSLARGRLCDWVGFPRCPLPLHRLSKLQGSEDPDPEIL